MSVPARNTSHVAEALALLTSAYKGKPVITAILTALANRTQELEDAIWALVDAVQLTNGPVGVWLDALGEIAGEPRLARGDAEYLLAVRAKLRVNRSKGSTVDVLEVMTLIGVAFTYLETPDAPGYFQVNVYALAYPATLARLLGLAKAAGIRAVLVYTDLPRAPVIVSGYTTSGVAVWDETTFGSAYGGELTSWAAAAEATGS